MALNVQINLATAINYAAINLKIPGPNFCTPLHQCREYITGTNKKTQKFARGSFMLIIFLNIRMCYRGQTPINTLCNYMTDETLWKLNLSKFKYTEH
jgi:hypothetical protein